MDHALLHAAPYIAALPAAIEHGAGALRVVTAPLVRYRDELGVGPDLAHVGVIPDGQLAALLRCRHHGGRAGVEGDHVDVLVEQRHGRVALLRRVEPDVEPHDLDARSRVDRAHPEGEGVDALQHLGNRKSGHVAGHVGLRHPARRDARQVAALVVTRVGGRDIGCGLVAGDRLELDVGKVFGDLQRRLHVAEARREDELVALSRQVANYAFGIGAFGHVLDVGCLDLAAQRNFHCLTALVVLMDPAGVRQRCDVDEGDLQRIARRGAGLRRLSKCGGKDRR